MPLKQKMQLQPLVRNICPVYSDGQKACYELKLRIYFTLYKKWGFKWMFEPEFETFDKSSDRDYLWGRFRCAV